MKVKAILEGTILGIEKKQYQDKISWSLKLLQEMNIASVSVSGGDVQLFEKGEIIKIEVEINDFKDRSGFYLKYLGLR